MAHAAAHEPRGLGQLPSCVINHVRPTMRSAALLVANENKPSQFLSDTEFATGQQFSFQIQFSPRENELFS